MNGVELMKIRSVSTQDKGCLSFLESSNDIPFLIKRFYYIYNVDKDVLRGGHAHKKLSQFLFCPYGSIDIILDDGHKKEVVTLDSPSAGLLICGPIWHDMIWNMDNSILSVCASDFYNESDYIRDYDEFLKYIHIGEQNESTVYTTEPCF